MASAINPTTQQFSTPYLTANEYRNAPTAIDIDNLVFNSTDLLFMFISLVLLRSSYSSGSNLLFSNLNSLFFG